MMPMRTAIKDGKKIYNFLQGDERYKYEMGGEDRFVYRVEWCFGNAS